MKLSCCWVWVGLLLGGGALLEGARAAEPFTVVNTAKTAELEIGVEEVTGKLLRYIQNGVRKEMELDLLDAENRKALVTFAREHGIYDRYPPLNVQTAIRDSDRRQEGSYFMRHLWLTPRVTIEGGEHLAPIPPLEVTVSIICADTEALYRHRKKVYQVRAKETKVVPEAPDGTRREIDLKTFELEFDEDKNSSNVGGWIYRYWITCLRDPESKRIVRFDTNYNVLQKYLEENPAERERFLAIGIGGSFPTALKEMAE